MAHVSRRQGQCLRLTSNGQGCGAAGVWLTPQLQCLASSKRPPFHLQHSHTGYHLQVLLSEFYYIYYYSSYSSRTAYRFEPLTMTDANIDETPISPTRTLERRDSLEKHLQHRPDAQDLKNRHILLDTNTAPYA